ncbi:MAG: lactate utilization protein C [Neisseriaceae bacterium]|nr:lactate utilization protein C [Neisseriaceae bacterium]
MSQAKERIFAKLRAAQAKPVAHPDVAAYYQDMGATWADDVARLKHWAATMRAVKTEIIWVTQANWLTHLAEVVRTKNIANLALPNGTVASAAIQQALPELAPGAHCTVMDEALEHCKDAWFGDTDAGFTEVCCGIAQTGTLLLWTSAQEPRSLSLIPPIHIALFDTQKLQPDFFSAMQALSLSENMPSNVVLVSGPSKTADIQLTLAYGAHGPKDLVVLALLPEGIDAADLAQA